MAAVQAPSLCLTVTACLCLLPLPAAAAAAIHAGVGATDAVGSSQLAALGSFNSEQLALVDMLVLAEAQAAVGHCMSSFSNFLRELRALRSRGGRESFQLIRFWKCDSTLYAGGAGEFAPP